MKLKTIKDFEEASEVPDPEHNAYGCYMGLIEDLKEEAIKHIRDLDEKYKEHGNHELSHNRTLRKWIVLFFNIEESDLK